jgi:NAD(P)-dependent dehydrogenase (short-subunit alcohol dehydrogenase family)
MLLDGKVMVVSGVGPGLGREIAAAAVREGASVMMGARTQANLEAAAAEIDPSGTRVGWQVTDITNAEQCAALSNAAVEKFGKLDALVNCAAFDSVFGGVEEANFEEWRQVFDTNVIGTLQVTQSAIPHLKKNGGAIVFIGSQGMFWPPKGFFQTAYQSSKAGLVSAMYHLANELGADKIRVNTVVPTWMWGPPVEGYVNMTADAQGIPPEQVIAGITQNMPLGEIPSDGDVAEAVIFFASDRARMITAQTLMVNAGEFPH